MPATWRPGTVALPIFPGAGSSCVPAALQVARACGCERLNLLIGLRQRRYSLAEQLACARDNVAWTADLAAEAGCEVMIEAINPMDNGPYLLTTTAAASSLITSPARATRARSGSSTARRPAGPRIPSA